MSKLYMWPEDGELMIATLMHEYYRDVASDADCIYIYEFAEFGTYGQPNPEKLGWVCIGVCT